MNLQIFPLPSIMKTTQIYYVYARCPKVNAFKKNWISFYVSYRKKMRVMLPKEIKNKLLHDLPFPCLENTLNMRNESYVLTCDELHLLLWAYFIFDVWYCGCKIGFSNEVYVYVRTWYFFHVWMLRTVLYASDALQYWLCTVLCTQTPDRWILI